MQRYNDGSNGGREMIPRDNLEIIRANLQADEATLLNAQITSLRETLNRDMEFPPPQSCCTLSPEEADKIIEKYIKEEK